MTKLYRGTVNNGVHTVLTEAAVAALQQRTDFFKEYGTYAGTEAFLRIAAAGTFSFVRSEHYTTHYRGFATGTLEELDAWAGGHLLPSPVSNYVPFSNGTRDQDPEFIRTPGEVAAAFNLRRSTATRS
jgi:hypothetical protein